MRQSKSETKKFLNGSFNGQRPSSRKFSVFKKVKTAKVAKIKNIQHDVISPFELRLQNPQGKVNKILTQNYLLERDTNRPRSFIKEFSQKFLSISPKDMKVIYHQMTESYALKEMTFKIKNTETGNYDKVFKVPFRGFSPLKKSQFDKIVQSTGPIMNALRDLLQTIYSEQNVDVTNLGLKNLPKEAQEVIFNVINSSIYLDKKFKHSVMKDYPFLPIGGFDAAINDNENTTPTFFEFNLGTPSGLSNNIQLFEEFKNLAPELFAELANKICPDNTFSLLKKIIDDNALAWTNIKDGISVIVGPGAFNAAHPDVASIAMFSGMPLVKLSDLYIDTKNFVRLNIGSGNSNPIVSGIYSRAEESFLLQCSKKGIGMRNPHFSNNKSIGKKIGVELENGVVYKFKYHNDKVVGVEFDINGNPKLEDICEGLAANPAAVSSDKKSLIDSVHLKKVYISNLGGRTLDDKRVFQIIADFLAPEYIETKDAPIARPPKTLEQHEYKDFYQSENLENYVVKAPDMSGGEGVYLLVNLDNQKRLEVVEMVKNDPKRYIIQKFADLSLMVTTETNSKGEVQYSTVANDWRIFVMQNSKGKIFADPQSVLLRVADVGSASTNTSQGAGYGLALVIENNENNITNIDRRSLPRPIKHNNIGLNRAKNLRNFVRQLNFVTELTGPEGEAEILASTLDTLAHLQRDVMDILGRDFSYFMTCVREFKEGLITKDAFRNKLMIFRVELQLKEFNVQKGRELIEDLLNNLNDNNIFSPKDERIVSRHFQQ